MSDEVKNYEISLMLKAEEAYSGVIAFIKEKGAQVQSENQIKRVRLAYPIKKEEVGFFSWIVVSALPEIIPALIRDLEVNPMVLRILAITPPLPAKTEGRSSNPRDKGVKIKPQKEQLAKPAKEVQSSQGGEALSNELLEKKLEEILK